MKAAILYEARTPLVIDDVQLGAMQADGVRLRVVASGLCHSDYHVMTGTLPHPMPVVLGHEASGIVEAVGECSQLHAMRSGSDLRVDLLRGSDIAGTLSSASTRGTPIKTAAPRLRSLQSNFL